MVMKRDLSLLNVLTTKTMSLSSSTLPNRLQRNATSKTKTGRWLLRHAISTPAKGSWEKAKRRPKNCSAVSLSSCPVNTTMRGNYHSNSCRLRRPKNRRSLSHAVQGPATTGISIQARLYCLKILQFPRSIGVPNRSLHSSRSSCGRHASHQDQVVLDRSESSLRTCRNRWNRFKERKKLRVETSADRLWTQRENFRVQRHQSWQMWEIWKQASQAFSGSEQSLKI